MSRVKRGVAAHRRHKKILDLAKGHGGVRTTHFRKANESVMKALSYAYRDRRARKGDFHRLWIVRINAAVRGLGMTYSQFMAALKANNVGVDRKMLAEMAVNDASGFQKLVQSLQTAPAPTA
ncbi:MAG: 50S ribosomal protein L20 [Chloroflexota bacterium]